MTLEQARAMVLERINADYVGKDSLVILDELTIEKPYGWVFFFNSKRFVETGEMIYAVGGNGPIVVESSSARVTRLGSARPPDLELLRFEEGMASRVTSTTTSSDR